MKKLIEELGYNFRGLWRANIVVSEDVKPISTKWMWYVTFTYRHNLLETNGDSTPEDALRAAKKCILT